MTIDEKERVDLKKVVGVPVRPPCRTNLNKVQALMSEQVGFSLTHSQVIQKVLADYLKLHGKDAA